jgi:hypothetical protein
VHQHMNVYPSHMTSSPRDRIAPRHDLSTIRACYRACSEWKTYLDIGSYRTGRSVRFEISKRTGCARSGPLCQFEGGGLISTCGMGRLHTLNILTVFLASLASSVSV